MKNTFLRPEKELWGEKKDLHQETIPSFLKCKDRRKKHKTNFCNNYNKVEKC